MLNNFQALIPNFLCISLTFYRSLNYRGLVAGAGTSGQWGHVASDKHQDRTHACVMMMNINKYEWNLNRDRFKSLRESQAKSGPPWCGGTRPQAPHSFKEHYLAEPQLLGTCCSCYYTVFSLHDGQHGCPRLSASIITVK